MGGVCSGGAAISGGSGKRNSEVVPNYLDAVNEFNGFDNCKKDSIWSPTGIDIHERNLHKFNSGEQRFFSPFKLKSSNQTNNKKAMKKVTDKNSVGGKAGTAGFEKVVRVLDTVGSSMPSFKSNSTFVPGTTSRGNEICILAFEVASTITKGANLLQSLSEDNLRFFKERILHSDGVQRLVSSDMNELLNIAAADKREEFDLITREVVRFGNLCKDPRWHNLGHYFQKLSSDVKVHKKSKEEAGMKIEELVTLAQHTSELYHELHALDRSEQDYRRKLEEVESLHLPRKGESLMLVNSELNHQRKLVRSLKKKSIWSKSLGEIVEKLVDAVAIIHEKISEVFDNNGTTLVGEQVPNHKHQRLGVCGLALHYANIIKQIESIMCLVSRPYSLPPNTRDSLYHGLPSGVKAAFLSRLQSIHREELTELQIRAEMEKTLHWIVPIAANTIKAHQGFGSIREWATASKEFSKRKPAHNECIRLQTLYHADKEKTESYILELVTWLHHLLSRIRQRYYGSKQMVPDRSRIRKKALVLRLESQQESCQANTSKTDRILELSKVDQDLLDDASSKRPSPGVSKSQEFPKVKKKRGIEDLDSSKSCGSSPSWDDLTVIEDLEHTRTNMLDLIDLLDVTD